MKKASVSMCECGRPIFERRNKTSGAQGKKGCDRCNELTNRHQLNLHKRTTGHADRLPGFCSVGKACDDFLRRNGLPVGKRWAPLDLRRETD